MPATSTTVRHNSSTTPTMYPTNRPTPPQRPTVLGYLDRITIAGLHNYLYAANWKEKVMWIVTFLVSIVGTMFYLVPTIQQYLEYTIVLDVQYRVEPGLELPPVWVCTPGINISYFDEQYDSVRSRLLVDKRMEVIIERFRKSWRRKYGPFGPEYVQMNWRTGIVEKQQAVWNSEFGVWDWNPSSALDFLSIQAKIFATSAGDSDVPMVWEVPPQVLVEILSLWVEAMGTNWHGYKTFYEQGTFQCESIVKNCSLNGIPFDCCRSDPAGRLRGTGKCFKVDLPREAVALNLHPNRASKFELSFETIVDSTYLSVFGVNDGTTSAITFGNRMSSPFEYEEHLGTGSITMITVRGIKKSELTNCTKQFRPDPRLHEGTHPMLRKYFEEMSNPKEYTVGMCELGKLLETLYKYCGCVPYYDTMRPQNDSLICRPQHTYACFYAATHDTRPLEGVDASSTTNVRPRQKRSTSSTTSEEDQDVLRRVEVAASQECLPLCESWTYDFFSSSMVSDGEAGNISRYFRNKAIIIFDPEYRVEQEAYKMDYHALIASLGDGFGLILGISAVTLIQLPIWAVAAVLLKRKLKRIKPLQGRPSVHPHVQRTDV